MTSRIDWNVIAAIGQVAGAVATFLAVVVSMRLARKARMPEVKLKVGERLIITQGQEETPSVLMISVTNTGERAIHVRQVGWHTGWFRFGPSWLRKQQAVQLTGSIALGLELPFELLPGEEGSTYCLMDNLEEGCRQKSDRPFFSRDYPLLGRRQTKVKATVYVAEGYSFFCKPEKAVIEALVKAEQAGLHK
jgi:hypothetical protein